MRPQARRQRPLCAFGQVLLCGWEKLQLGTEPSSMRSAAGGGRSVLQLAPHSVGH